MLSIIRFLRGYVRVYLTGFSPERFMNLCNNHQMEIWDVMPIRDGYEFNMYIDGFFACKDFLRKTQTKVVLRRKLGLPFLMFRYRKRKLFFIGLIGCFGALFFATRFIWAFEIDGNRQLTEDMFLRFLENQQVHYGMSIDELDIDSFEKALRENYEYITWASAKIEGTKLLVTIKENDVISETAIYEGETGDLRATVSGNVISIVTRTGVPMVKKDDAVKVGDVLISGIIPIYNDDTTLRSYHEARADGDVIIESVIDYKDPLSMLYEEKIYSDELKRIKIIGILDKEFKLGKVHTEKQYEVLSVRKAVRLLDNLYLPIIYGHNDYIEYKIVQSTYTREEAAQILNDRFLRFCETLEEKGVQIIQKNVKIDYIGEYGVMEGQLVVRQKGVELTPITEFPTIVIPKEQPIE